MPNLSIAIAEVQESILRPVTLDIVRQLEEITKIPKDTVILFPGQLEKSYQPGSAITEKGQDRTQFLGNNLIQIEVEEDYYRDAVLTTAVTRPEHLPVFNDNNLGVLIKPIYATTEMSINFKFRSKSKTSSIRWRDDIRMRVSMMRDINLHQVSYHYTIPVVYISLLKEIHRLRETVQGYGEDFPTYLTDNSSTRLTELSNQSGMKTELGIAETQMRIVGYFDFEGFPEKPEHDEESDTWICTFGYKFKYEKPIACNMTYPVMIHNQVLSTKYRPSEQAYNIDDHLQSYSLSTNAFNYFEAQLQAQKYVNQNSVITIPDFDEFLPSSIPSGTVSIFNVLCQLTLEDKKTLINLKELDTIKIDSDIMEFLENSEWPYISKLYKSVLHVSLYRSMTLATSENVVVKSNLDICSLNDLNIRLNHRVRFSIVGNIQLLDQDALNRLKKYPKALVKILSSIDEALRNNPGFRDLANKGYISRDDLLKYINKQQHSANVRDLQTDRGLLTVMTTQVIARDGTRTADINEYLKTK